MGDPLADSGRSGLNHLAVSQGEGMTHTERLAELRRNLVEYYSDEELRTLCFDLGVDCDNLPGRAKADKA